MKAKRIFEEDERFPGEDGPFIADDGWDEEALEEVGLMDWIENVERLTYEVRNARRGSYGVSGDTAEFLIRDLEEIKQSLESILDEMHERL